MKTLKRMAIIFIASLVVARLVDVFLRSDVGKRTAKSVGLDSLLTAEGAEAAKRYSKTATGLLVGTALALRARRPEKEGRHDSNLVHTAENLAELVLAAGTLAKIVADFLREEQEMRQAGAAS